TRNPLRVAAQVAMRGTCPTKRTKLLAQMNSKHCAGRYSIEFYRSRLVARPTETIMSRSGEAPSQRLRVETGELRPMTNRTTAPVGSCVRFSAIAVLCAALVAGAAGEALSQYAPQPRRPLFPTAPALPQQPHPAVARVVVQEVDGQSYGSGTLVHTCGEYG